jgi:membrane associated rhomboid family serine protease
MGGLIPLGDLSRRTRRFPFVTALIIAANAIVFLMELGGGDAFVNQWAVIPADITSGHHWVTVFTAMFMHGGWMHIIGNMIFFWAFGPEIEDAMNPLKYLIFYLLGGLVATLVQVAADPHSTLPNLGASGAIAAVMGGFLVTYPRDEIRTVWFVFFFFQVTMMPAIVLIGFWFLTQLFNAGAVAHVQHGGVAYMAHVGGFIFGAITAKLFEDSSRIGGVPVSE